MAHEENSVMSADNETHRELANEERSIQQQLADAHEEIANLKMQLKWLERSYD